MLNVQSKSGAHDFIISLGTDPEEDFIPQALLKATIATSKVLKQSETGFQGLNSFRL